MFKRPEKFTPEYFNGIGAEQFPEHIGVTVTDLQEGRLTAHFTVKRHHHAPNGFLHAGSIVTLADTAAGYGCVAHLPEDASGFTTVELKANFLGTAREGEVECVAQAVHLGRTTQVWDATVTHRLTGKTIALFRCTQMVLYPKG